MENNHDLRQMTYEQFGNLRFCDFFAQTNDYFKDDMGIYERQGIGLCNSESNTGTTYFASLLDSDKTISIKIDFDDEPSEIEGNALLTWLGLNLKKGMPYQDILKILGAPEDDKFRPPTPGHSTNIRYVIGSNWPYYLECFVTDQTGLTRVWICRKDVSDRHEECV
jgi:hypothetical protein